MLFTWNNTTLAIHCTSIKYIKNKNFKAEKVDIHIINNFLGYSIDNKLYGTGAFCPEVF